MIDLETVKRWALEEISKELEGGSFVYKSSERLGGPPPLCEYVEMDLDSNGQVVPSCLIGRMLLNNGVVSVDDLLEGDNNHTSVRNLTRELDIEVEHGAGDFLVALQRKQDDGQPWGLAYESAVYFAEAIGDRRHR